MVDGAIVLVDAAEGPMPQTKFVVGKALKIGLKPIVCINKVDKADARPSEVVNEVFDLFAALDATDEQLDFPILYGSAAGLDGALAEGPKEHGAAVRPCPETCRAAEGRRRRLPHARHSARGQSLSRPHHDRARFSGSMRTNAPVKALDRQGDLIEQGRVTRILAFRGIERAPIDEAVAGDIVAIAGLEKFNVADTL